MSLVVDLWMKKLAEQESQIKMLVVSRQEMAKLGMELVRAGVSIMAYAGGDDWTKAMLKELVARYDATGETPHVES